MTATWLSALITAYDGSRARCVAPLASDPQGMFQGTRTPMCPRSESLLVYVSAVTGELARASVTNGTST
jgi:hypothetical protein